MAESDVLLKPEECVMLLVYFQAEPGFGVESICPARAIAVANGAAMGWSLHTPEK